MDQAFGRQLDALHEQAELLDAGDDGVHLLADRVLQIDAAA